MNVIGFDNSQRQVVEQRIPEGPIPRPRSPHKIVVGQHVRGGPRVTLDTEHLTAAEAQTVTGPDFLPPGPAFDEARAELDGRREALDTAWEQLRNLGHHVMEERQARVLADPKRPRLDPERLRAERREAAWGCR